ncbi:hypothetical protein B9Z55_012086 [Caenorhabditis nigoni]|nr:hypothetical protein B9Z55_012086 [Caenorhabditis nigoni]
MKVLLVAGILLCCALIAAPTALHRMKRKGSSEDDKEKIAEMINNIRRSMAVEYDISNMHKLKYDGNLKVKDPCSQEDWLDQKKMQQLESEKNVEGFIKLLADNTYYSCFYPGQTSIACRLKICEEQERIGYRGERILCVCGPERRFDKSSMKIGEPGTECDGEEDDGLCEETVPTTTVKINTTTSKTKAMEKHEYDYEEDGSSNVFTTAIILNLIAFYLVASFL